MGEIGSVHLLTHGDVCFSETTTLSHSKYLIPYANSKLEKSIFVRYEHPKTVMKLEKGSTIKLKKQDIIFDLPPKAESLKNSVAVYIPVMYDSYGKNATATCGKGENGEYLNGKFVSEIYAKMKYAVNVTNNGEYVKRSEARNTFIIIIIIIIIIITIIHCFCLCFCFFQ